jgi:hypothetical protein
LPCFCARPRLGCILSGCHFFSFFNFAAHIASYLYG